MNPTTDPSIGPVTAPVNSSHAAPSGEMPPPEQVGPLAYHQRWRGFQVGHGTKRADHFVYAAVNLADMTDASIFAWPLTEAIEWRRKAWAALGELQDAPLLKGVEAHEEEGHRFEVYAAPPTTTLREWFVCHTAGLPEIEKLVRQIGSTLAALHARGVVHLNLGPENVYLIDAEKGLDVLIGGLDQATMCDQPGLISAEPNPFYAPPESAGLTRHSPGEGLQAWDWWSFGRVLQEFIGGRHILGLMLNRDVSRPTPELREKAEALLLEREPPGRRAGAVEAMPKMDSKLRALLRGLLTGSRDGRWGEVEVFAWLDGKTPPDRYDLPRNEPLFRFRRRGWLPAEAAALFSRTDEWDEGERQLFATEQRGTLGNFLSETLAQRPLWERLGNVFALAELPAWRDVPPEARRTAMAAIAWLLMSGSGASLCVRGKRIDAAGLSWLMTALGDQEKGVGIVTALLAPPAVQLITSVDPGGGQALGSVQATIEQAAKCAIAHGWIEAGDPRAHAAIVGHALLEERQLQERLKKLRTEFASNRDPELAAFFTAAQPPRWALVLLAYTSEWPAQFGYVSHDEWHLSRFMTLRERSSRLVAALAWRRLGRVLALLPWLSCSRLIYGVAVLGISAWLARHAPREAIILALGLLAWRVWCERRVLQAVKACDSAAARWQWGDGLARCRREAALAAPEAAEFSPRKLAAEVHTIEAEIATLPLSAPPTLLRPASRCVDLFFGGFGGVAVALILTIFAWPEDPDPPSPIAEVTPSPATTETVPTPVAPPAPRDPNALAPGEEYEFVETGFGPQRIGPLVAWRPPARNPVDLPVLDHQPVTPEQLAYARVGGRLLVSPYVRRTIHALVAVPVPAKDGVGLILYHGRKRIVVDDKVYVVRNLPKEPTFIDLGERSAVFLGVPPEIAPDISLAQP